MLTEALLSAIAQAVFGNMTWASTQRSDRLGSP